MDRPGSLQLRGKQRKDCPADKSSWLLDQPHGELLPLPMTATTAADWKGAASSAAQHRKGGGVAERLPHGAAPGAGTRNTRRGGDGLRCRPKSAEADEGGGEVEGEAEGMTAEPRMGEVARVGDWRRCRVMLTERRTAGPMCTSATRALPDGTGWPMTAELLVRARPTHGLA